MSGGYGWPGAAPPPGPARGGGDGRRVGVLFLAIAVLVGASFGLAKATGADTRDGGGSAAAPGMPDGGGLGDLPGPDGDGGALPTPLPTPGQP
ncbi:hypothetical protein ACSNOC_24895, partial [Streptomyces sp. URMC 129]